MTTFIALVSETQQGEANISESVDRARAFQEESEELGVTVLATYWTMGTYDGVLVFDAADDEAAAAALCKLNSTGSVRTNTLRAFSAEQMERILAKSK